MKLDTSEFIFLGICIEGFLYGTISLLQVSNFFKAGLITGLYSGIFALYLQYRSSKREADNKTLFYAFCALYIVCGIMIFIDIAAAVIRDVSNLMMI